MQVEGEEREEEGALAYRDVCLWQPACVAQRHLCTIREDSLIPGC